MKVALLDGARADGTVLDRAAEAFRATLAGQEVAWLRLRELEIHHCLGCFGCWVKTPGECVIDDAGRDVARHFVQSDVAIWMTPVTFGGYSSELKKAVDRLIPNIQPFFKPVHGEIHHVPRYERYPRFLLVGALLEPDPEAETLFRRLAARNQINMYSTAHVGFVYERDNDDQVAAVCEALLAQAEAAHA